MSPEETRYHFARAHAERLHAAAYAAEAQARRLCPWLPADYRKRDAESCEAQAARHLDRAAEAETDATETEEA